MLETLTLLSVSCSSFVLFLTLVHRCQFVFVSSRYDTIYYRFSSKHSILIHASSCHLSLSLAVPTGSPYLSSLLSIFHTHFVHQTMWFAC